MPAPRHVIAIHGGGGVCPRAEMTPELEAAYRADLARALAAGNDVLAAGGSAVDAVEAAIRIMEDSIDRREAGDFMPYRRDSASNRASFERLFRDWAKASVTGLDELKQLSPIDSEGQLARR